MTSVEMGSDLTTADIMRCKLQQRNNSTKKLTQAIKMRLTCLQSALATILFFVAWSVLGAPYHGEEFTYHQPDGSTFQVRLYGDEFYAVAETLDGHVVTRDPKTKFFCYATANATKTEFLSTGVKIGKAAPMTTLKRQRLDRRAIAAKRKARRKEFGVDDRGMLLPELQQQLMPQDAAALEAPQPAPPSTTITGTRVGLVLLAQFPDRPQDVAIAKSEVDSYCNDPNYTGFGNVTSVYGYFHIQSNGALQYNCVVTAYFTADHNRSYYADPTINDSSRSKELINEGLAVLKVKGFDFAVCDGDRNGVLDGVNLFYAGDRVNSWAEGLWPHAGGSSWSGLAGTGVSTSFLYQITDMTSSPKLGTFCHENGHMICGFPDLYSYDGNAARVSQYSLMSSSGPTHPVGIDPYLKIQAGWANVIDVTSSSHLRGAVQLDQNTFYRYRNPSESREYFLISIRRDSGYEGDHGNTSFSVNPTDGLVIYHAYEHGSNTHSSIFRDDSPNADYSRPYELLVVEANPSSLTTPWYDSPSPGIDDGYHAYGVSEASDETLPALKFWDTSTGRTVASGLHIHNIGDRGDQITFTIGTGAVTGSPVIATTKRSLTPSCEYETDAAPETFSVFNAGGGTLSYSITDSASWLSLSTTTGTASTEADAITVTYNTDGLPSGSYNETITITGAETYTIPVALTVAAQPTIQLDKNHITTALYPNTSKVVSFTISNIGGGTLSYTLSESVDWLTLDTFSGTVAAEKDEIHITLDSSGLAPDSYSANITVSSDNATSTSEIITVEFICRGGPNSLPVIESDPWAAPDIVALPETSTVSVVASDPDGDALTYAWSMVNGPAPVIFTSPDTDVSEIIFDSPGTYFLRVTVSDGVDSVDSELITITVNPNASFPAEGQWYFIDNSGTSLTWARLMHDGTGTPALVELSDESNACKWQFIKSGDAWFIQNASGYRLQDGNGFRDPEMVLGTTDQRAQWDVEKGSMYGAHYFITSRAYNPAPRISSDGTTVPAMTGTVTSDRAHWKILETTAPITNPTVEITSHSEGDQVQDNQDLIVTVNASDDSGIQRVGLWSKEEQAEAWDWHEAVTTEPYQWNLGQLQLGTYTLSTKAYAEDGGTATAAITIEVTPGSTEPTITISSHAEGDQVLNNQDLIVTVDASDDSGIQRVGLWSKEEQATAWDWHEAVTTEPYQWNLGQLQVGTYTLSTKAYANDGGTATAAITIEVTPGSTEPTITISSHAEGDQVLDNQDLIVTVDASDDSGIQRVGLWSKEEQATAWDWHEAVTTQPYQWNLGQLQVGTYTLSTKAYANDGGTATAAITIEVISGATDPTISITSHSNGDQVSASQDVIVKADASDDSGINRSRLFLDGVGQDVLRATPYEWNLGKLTPGFHTLKARAFPNDGGSLVDTEEIVIEVIP